MAKLSRYAYTGHGGHNSAVLTLHFECALLTTVTNLNQLHAKERPFHSSH